MKGGRDGGQVGRRECAKLEGQRDAALYSQSKMVGGVEWRGERQAKGCPQTQDLMSFKSGWLAGCCCVPGMVCGGDHLADCHCNGWDVD